MLLEQKKFEFSRQKLYVFVDFSADIYASVY